MSRDYCNNNFLEVFDKQLMERLPGLNNTAHVLRGQNNFGTVSSHVDQPKKFSSIMSSFWMVKMINKNNKNGKFNVLA